MASRTVSRLTDRGPALPAMATLPSLANTLYPRDTIVTRNAAGRAVSPSTADASGFPAVGISKATFDNRTGSEMGGLNDSGDIEVDCGVFGFDISGATPLPGDRVYVVDNQTVSVDAGVNRGFAGIVSEVRTGSSGVAQAFVWMGPAAMAAAGVSGTSGGTSLLVHIPALPAWGDGTANGLDPATGAFGFNPTIDDEPFKAAVSLPDGIDGETDLVVRATMSISSVATDDDVVAVLVAKVDGGADVAPVSATVLAVAEQDIEFIIPAADVPAGSKSLYIEIDCAGTLDTHDAYLSRVEIALVRAA